MIRKKYIGVFVFALLSLSSCGDFLKSYSQDTDYARSWRDLDELLIGSAYQSLYAADDVASVQDNQYFLHFLADELDENTTTYDDDKMLFDGKERVFGYYTWQARSGINDTGTGYSKENDSWAEYYQRINVANNIIESAKDLSQVSDEDRLGKLKVEGEAHFLRAYYYFMLVNMYGKAYTPSTAATDAGVPIKTSEVVEDQQFQRNSVQECYDLIVSDLLTAEQDLAQYGAQRSRYRIDVTGVRLFLSRVYLYMQNWDMARQYAQMVVSAHPALTNLNTGQATEGIITDNSREIIFSMGSNSVMEYTMNYLKSFTITNATYNRYANDDLRKTRYIYTHGNFHGYAKMPARLTVQTKNPVVSTDDSYYFTYYYNAYAKERNDLSDKNLLRSAEAYLNLAEAQAYLGNEAAARDAVNRLRENRFTTGSNYQLTSSGNQLINDIREERAREFLLEGHRWFDLRRYAVNTVYPQTTSITHTYYFYENRDSATPTARYVYTLEPNDWGWILPIPQSVIDFNRMQQNPRGVRTATIVQL